MPRRFCQGRRYGNDAAAETFQLVERADNAVALESVELLPDHGVANAGGGLDDAVFVHAISDGGEQVMQHHGVNADRVAMRGQRIDAFNQQGLGFGLFL